MRSTDFWLLCIYKHSQAGDSLHFINHWFVKHTDDMRVFMHSVNLTDLSHSFSPKYENELYVFTTYGELWYCGEEVHVKFVWAQYLLRVKVSKSSRKKYNDRRKKNKRIAIAMKFFCIFSSFKSHKISYTQKENIWNIFIYDGFFSALDCICVWRQTTKCRIKLQKHSCHLYQNCCYGGSLDALVWCSNMMNDPLNVVKI